MRRAAVIAGVYAVVGCGWIVLTDVGVDRGTADVARLGYEVTKGIGFVLVTAALLFVSLVGLYGHQETLARSLATVSTASENERARRRRVDALLAAVADAADDLVWVFDAERRILVGNRAAWASIGVPPRDGPVDLVAAGWPTTSRAAIAADIDAVIAGERRSGRIIYAVDGVERTIDYLLQPAADPETGERRVLAVAHDVTSVLAAEAAHERARRILKAVIASLSAIQHNRDRKALAQSVTRALRDEAGFDVVWIGVTTGDEALPVTPIAVSGAEPAAIKRLIATTSAMRIGRWPTVTAMRTGKPALVDDIAGNPHFGALPEEIKALGYHAAFAFPIRFAGRTFGTLTIYSRTVTPLAEESIGPLTTLVEQLAYAFASLDSLVRYEESEAGRLAALSRIKEALIETVGALAGVVEVRDPYTAGHQRRVAAIATAIGRRKGWPEERVEGLRLGAVIHDIGKIGVPAELLVKPGRLTDEEFALIKTHAALGGEMVKHLHFDWPIYEMVTQHHERLDGSGYPAGLRDDAIAPEAKVLAVADVVDAMLSNRPYRASKTLDDVERELAGGRGIRYEAESVDICLALLAERGIAAFGDDVDPPAAAAPPPMHRIGAPGRTDPADR